MKFISWNVNGLRACLNKGFMDFFNEQQPDICCLQETKLHPGQIELNLDSYEIYWNSAFKKGYSGTAVFTKIKPNSVFFNLGQEEHDQEGRIITLNYENFYLVNVYAPNSQRGLARLDYRLKWQDDFCNYLKSLDEKKPVIICGDFNVAHKEIDIKNPKKNEKNAGFTPEERKKMSELLDSGFVDTFRYLYPDLREAYTWWSYMFKAREKNIGWRIDYFLVSERIKSRIKNATIYAEVMGSDHCPIGLEIDF
ncbi:MAG: exodeoxyribonuclease III [Zhaonellaceae bacterium]|nr:exodeoxyribonuclease III [Clostridia bacterium]